MSQYRIPITSFSSFQHKFIFLQWPLKRKYFRHRFQHGNTNSVCFQGSLQYCYEGFYWQYGSYLLITLIGILIFKKINSKRVFMGALSSSTIFFLISNFHTVLNWVESCNLYLKFKSSNQIYFVEILHL